MAQFFWLDPGRLLCVYIVVEPGLVLSIPLCYPVTHYQLVVGGLGGGWFWWVHGVRVGIGGQLQAAPEGGGDVHSLRSREIIY